MRHISQLCQHMSGPLDTLYPGSCGDLVLSAMTFDSRTCTYPCAFFAFSGLHTDGTLYIDQAIERGACLIICKQLPEHIDTSIWYLVTESPRQAYGACAGAWFDYPADDLDIIAVTGTDGKSSTCDFLWQLLHLNNIKAGLLGTITMDDGKYQGPTPYRNSTPEAYEIQDFLHRCRANGLQTVILEATSHGLSDAYDRLHGISYQGAIYTSISSEHLEFHKSLEAYVQAKLNLARRLKPDGILVLANDNPYKQAIVTAAPQGATALTYAIGEPSTADLCASVISSDLHRTSFSLNGNEYSIPIAPLCFLKNALAAILCSHGYTHISVKKLAADLRSLKPVAGRFNIVPSTLDFTTIIDFAHTADAFHQLLSDLHRISPSSNLIAVFAATGERDTTKRGPMGKEAARWCQQVILTIDDPRDEDPQAICSQIMEGIPKELLSRRTVTIIPDRALAIAHAVRQAHAGDIVLLLGKGPEKVIQLAQGKTMAWDERQVVETQLRKLEACKESCFL